VTIATPSSVLPEKPTAYDAVNDAARQESIPVAAENAATASAAGGDIELLQLRERLTAYLNVLGIKDAAKSDVIAADALTRARRKVAPGLKEELFRRARGGSDGARHPRGQFAQPGSPASYRY